LGPKKEKHFALIEKGHEENQLKQKIVYQAKTGLSVAALRQDLETHKQEDLLLLEKLKASLEKHSSSRP